ncbi:putative tail fiber protein [Acinetobacter phage Ac42]|uniref:tail fiber protein n=1 Tax=Acinetobacter phage Ac42 TaxID=762660 RepID=UPI0001EBCE1E|nr:tail fiber protein [Acinetobacter phage Ac42]ADI96482.1 putative tail fiber protein [Acinetobacter phage Ac42]
MALDQNINRIKFLRTTVAGRKPALADLQDGELALNMADRVLYTRNGNNIVDVGFGLGGNVNGSINATGELASTKVVTRNPNNSAANISVDWVNDEPRLRIGGSNVGSASDFVIAGSSDFERMRLTSAGAMTIPSTMTANSFVGIGSGLTQLNASMLATGTVPTARLSGNYSINSATTTKLATQRQIFGNLFDGSADVFGAITQCSTLQIDQSSYPSVRLKPTGTAGTLGTIFEAGPTGWPYVAVRLKETLDWATGQIAIFAFPSNKTGSHTIAMTSDNVASATKLATARTINGVAFDGTQNIVIEDDTKLYKANRTVNLGTASGNQAVYRDIASLASGQSYAAGVSIVVHLPKSKNKSQTMLQMKIKGSNYSSANVDWEFSIFGYNHATKWFNQAASVSNGMNDLIFESIQFGRTSDHEVIILKVASNKTLSLPSIDITELICNHENVDNWNASDFRITAESDLSPYTIESEVFVGSINTKQTKGYSTITLLTLDEMKKVSPIVIPEHHIQPDASTGISYAPWIYTAHQSNSGYRVNCAIGSYRGGSSFTDNGMFIGLSQNGNLVSEGFKFLTQGKIEHTLGSITFGHNVVVDGSIKPAQIQNADSTGFMSILNGGGAHGIAIGGLLVSNSYATSEKAKVPTNGAYIKGQLVVSDTISIEANGTAFQKMIQCANNTDGGYVAVGNTGADKGYVELGTIDDSDTKIYVRKRNSSNAVLATQVLMDENHNAQFVGNLSAANGLAVGSTASANGYGIGLYGGNAGTATSLPSYGLAFAGTSTFGSYGGVTDEWATYFTMTGATTRGWVFKAGDSGTANNIASISASGAVVANSGFHVNTPYGAWANNGMRGGTGDAANYTTHNLIIRSHWGIGFRDNTDACRIVMDTRSGRLSLTGGITAGEYSIDGNSLDPMIYAPIPYAKTTAPAGYLLMMGQAISAATYPKLYALYGANLPDMRGMFIRGWDNGRGIDSGRGILTTQADAIQNITGSLGSIRRYTNNTAET